MGEICNQRKSIITSMGPKVDEKEADLALLETQELLRKMTSYLLLMLHAIRER